MRDEDIEAKISALEQSLAQTRFQAENALRKLNREAKASDTSIDQRLDAFRAQAIARLDGIEAQITTLDQRITNNRQQAVQAIQALDARVATLEARAQQSRP